MKVFICMQSFKHSEKQQHDSISTFCVCIYKRINILSGNTHIHPITHTNWKSTEVRAEQKQTNYWLIWTNTMPNYIQYPSNQYYLFLFHMQIKLITWNANGPHENKHHFQPIIQTVNWWDSFHSNEPIYLPSAGVRLLFSHFESLSCQMQYTIKKMHKVQQWKW